MNEMYIFSDELLLTEFPGDKDSPETLERIFDWVKLYQYTNFYFYFTEDKHKWKYALGEQLELCKVYACSVGDTEIKHVGYFVDKEYLTRNPILYPHQFVEDYRDLMVVYDGEVVNKDTLPMYLHSVVNTKTSISKELMNPVPAGTSMSSEVGNVVVSSCHALGLPQHAFLPFMSSADTLHMQEEWRSSTDKLDEEQFIGYQFKDKRYILKTVTMLGRLGPTDAPGKRAPSPKLLYIDGKKSDGTWVALTNLINVPANTWQFLKPVEISLNDPSNVIPYCGFRVRVTAWHPGDPTEEPLLTGLMRVQFMCNEYTEINSLPNIPGLVDQTTNTKLFTYAQFNSRLIGTAPKCTREAIDTEPTIEDSVEVVKSSNEETVVTTADESFVPTYIEDNVVSEGIGVRIGGTKEYFDSLLASRTSKPMVNVLYTEEDLVFTDDNLEDSIEVYCVAGAHQVLVYTKGKKFIFNTKEKSYNISKLSLYPGSFLIVSVKDGRRYITCIEGNKLN